MLYQLFENMTKLNYPLNLKLTLLIFSHRTVFTEKHNTQHIIFTYFKPVIARKY